VWIELFGSFVNSYPDDLMGETSLFPILPLTNKQLEKQIELKQERIAMQHFSAYIMVLNFYE
jgi:hypothetical protein